MIFNDEMKKEAEASNPTSCYFLQMANKEEKGILMIAQIQVVIFVYNIC